MTETPFIPHDIDNGPDPKPVTKETKTPDRGPAVTDVPTPERTKVRKNPDGTEHLEVQKK